MSKAFAWAMLTDANQNCDENAKSKMDFLIKTEKNMADLYRTIG